MGPGGSGTDEWDKGKDSGGSRSQMSQAEPVSSAGQWRHKPGRGSEKAEQPHEILSGRFSPPAAAASF